MTKKTTREERATARSAKRDAAASALTLLAGPSKRARAMAEAEPFRAVPTILSSFNRASTVGGAPLSCVWLLHGPSMGGKTAFACALIRSFQDAGGMAAFVDAELSGDTKRWFRQLGVDPARCLYVGRTRPDEDVPALTYEEVVEEVDGILTRYRSAKREGKIAAGTPLVVVVDSISKMVPGSLMKKLEKDGGSALSGGVGRMQALLNTAWLAELGVTVGSDDVAFVVIAHEMEAATTPGRWVPDFKVRGGAALVYDSMMQVRVTYAGQVKDSSNDGAEAVGKRHRVKILKNKHGPAYQEAHFYTANGAGLAAAGFDRARELVHEALLRGVLKGPDPQEGLTAGARLEMGKEKTTLKRLLEPGGAELLAKLEVELFGGAR